jgi:hypothetical protein
LPIATRRNGRGCKCRMCWTPTATCAKSALARALMTRQPP